MILILITVASGALVLFRQPVFAACGAYLCSVLLYVAHADGIGFQYLWPNLPQFNSMVSVVFGSGVMVFGGLFAIAFLQTARFHRIMDRVLLAFIASVMVFDVVLWATDPQLLKRLLVIMISVSALTFLTAALVAARTRFREVRSTYSPGSPALFRHAFSPPGTRSGSRRPMSHSTTPSAWR